ncbi:MAG: prepilin-type N-terminal cleavage/methylation domain-containing protein, partial [Akkermansiaceae bacterium]|nr:prepilin-type N-terminal cleavage/methylation domain-containing protein [Akkermansiaceae bacterium]
MKCATLHKPIPARGFTLVEVLVVVCILVVLAVVSFSSGKAMLTRARIIESTSNLRSLAVANVVYASDSGAFCPAADQFNNRRWHGA